jgi:hypothetical protein
MAGPWATCGFLDKLISDSLAALPRLTFIVKTKLTHFRRVDAFETDFDTADAHGIAVNNLWNARQIRAVRAGHSNGQQQKPG